MRPSKLILGVVTCIKPTLDGKYILCGDSKGCLSVIDLNEKKVISKNDSAHQGMGRRG